MISLFFLLYSFEYNSLLNTCLQIWWHSVRVSQLFVLTVCCDWLISVANQAGTNSSAQPLLNAAKTLAASKKNGGRPVDTSPSQGYNRSGYSPHTPFNTIYPKVPHLYRQDISSLHAGYFRSTSRIIHICTQDISFSHTSYCTLTN